MKTVNKIVVAGGEGFIGKNVKSLLGDKYEIVSIDKNPSADLVFNLEETWPHVKSVDAVVCLASNPNVWRSGKVIDVDHEARILCEAIKFCRRTGAKRLIHASSSNVYGGWTNDPPFHELMGLNPSHSYGIQKVNTERMLSTLAPANLDIQITSIRLFNVIGKHQRKTMFPYIIADSLISGKDIPVYGLRHRSWTPVKDVVNFIELVVNKEPTLSLPQLYNFGATQLWTQNSLIRLFVSRMPVHGFDKYQTMNASLILHPPREEEMEVSQPDMGRTLDAFANHRLYNNSLTEAVDDVIQTVMQDHKLHQPA